MNKLEKINKLIENDFKLEKYINEIQEKKFDMPEDLPEKVLSKINKKKKHKYVDICKIVACLIFSLAVCRMDFITNDEMKDYRKEENKPKSIIYINEKVSSFCKWAITPIEKEEEEK